MFKVGDKVKLNENIIRFSVDIANTEAEIIGITDDGLYELGFPKADIALHGDYLELVEEEEQNEYFTGKAVYVGDSLNDFVFTNVRQEGYTPGKIYEFKDGYTFDDDGDRRPICTLHDKILNEGLREDELESFGFYPITD